MTSPGGASSWLGRFTSRSAQRATPSGETTTNASAAAAPPEAARTDASAARLLQEQQCREREKEAAQRRRRSLEGEGVRCLSGHPFASSGARPPSAALSRAPPRFVRQLSETERAARLAEHEQKEEDYARLRKQKLTVADFEPLTIIGRGAFGEVRARPLLDAAASAWALRWAFGCPQDKLPNKSRVPFPSSTPADAPPPLAAAGAPGA